MFLIVYDIIWQAIHHEVYIFYLVLVLQWVLKYVGRLFRDNGQATIIACMQE